MSPTLALLHRCSWTAEKLFRQRGSFRTVLWLTENRDGQCERIETGCDAPREATDAETLDRLVDEMRIDFAQDQITRFAVAYAGTAVTFTTTLAREPLQRRCECVAVEAHDSDQHLRAWREIIRPPGRAPLLGALSAVEDATTSRYATLLACLPA
jgi:hypothetical protein